MPYRSHVGRTVRSHSTARAGMCGPVCGHVRVTGRWHVRARGLRDSDAFGPAHVLLVSLGELATAAHCLEGAHSKLMRL